MSIAIANQQSQSLQISNVNKLTVQISAISFIGNASNKTQQDALFVIDKAYQSKDLLLKTVDYQVSDKGSLCIAVSDGVASSPYAEQCSHAIVNNIAEQWKSNKAISMRALYHQVANADYQYLHASATLAMIDCHFDWHMDDTDNGEGKIRYDIHIRHIGDSRVYRFSQHSQTWQCLTHDHNVLNQEIAERIALNPHKSCKYQFNQEGMASFYYALTECLMINPNTDENPMPRYDSQRVKVDRQDCLLICTDGIHDLLPAEQWQIITSDTDLTDWLTHLKQQVYDSKGNAYDNGTAVLVRF